MMRCSHTVRNLLFSYESEGSERYKSFSSLNIGDLNFYFQLFIFLYSAVIVDLK